VRCAPPLTMVGLRCVVGLLDSYGEPSLNREVSIRSSVRYGIGNPPVAAVRAWEGSPSPPESRAIERQCPICPMTELFRVKWDLADAYRFGGYGRYRTTLHI
jgi:hypothetical protein